MKNYFILFYMLLIIIRSVGIIYALRQSIKYTVKIFNWKTTYFTAFIYILYYIILLLILRFLSLNREIDLTKHPTVIYRFLEKYSPFEQFLYVLVGILILVLWFLILIMVRKVLSWKCWQLHFYWANLDHVIRMQQIYYKNLISEKSYSSRQLHWSKLYNKFLRKFWYKYSVARVCELIYDLIGKLWIPFMHKFIDPEYHHYYNSGAAATLRYYILFGLVGIFVYEFIFYDFILHYTIDYLFFYMIFMLWYRFSDLSSFITGQPYYNQIIFERSYCEPEIYYINLTLSDEVELFNIIKNPSDLSTQRDEADDLFDGFVCVHPILVLNRFHKVKAKDYYYLFDDSSFSTADEIIWCNHFCDPSFMYWFNASDLIVDNGNSVINMRKESKIISEND